MNEIAEVLQLVLSNVRGEESGGAARSGKYMLDSQIAAEATRRVHQLVRQFPLYPELDLELMLESISVEA